MKTVSVLDYGILNCALYDKENISGTINTLNPHSYCIAQKDKVFESALKSSDILLPDGVGIVWAAAILKGVKIKKIAGYDLHLFLLQRLQNEKGSCFYLGASDNTLEEIKKRIKNEYPNVTVGTYSPPFKKSFSDFENNAMINAINKFNPDVLFVGMTAPKQEKWVYENKEKIHAKTICSIGAVFDFYAGTIKRANPVWIKLGLEFLPRLLKEPRRLWKRNFISTPLFLWDVFLYFVGLKRND
jgi:N-acetylglucosaminyldiphosphoundecaprenol N-acetyl-beta-D-mannosaminyltransferase